jgi:hypothetical protein
MDVEAALRVLPIIYCVLKVRESVASGYQEDNPAALDTRERYKESFERLRGLVGDKVHHQEEYDQNNPKTIK